MKKWHKRCIIFIVVIAAVAIAAFGVYEFYAKDKIERTLEKAQSVLNDEKLQSEVEDFVNEMVEDGDLEASMLDGYNKYKEASKSADPSKKTKTLMERVREAMTAEEFAFAMSIYSKVDISYVLANLNTNREAVKTYVKSVLTSSEISRSLEIYGKYSYLLK